MVQCTLQEGGMVEKEPQKKFVFRGTPFFLFFLSFLSDQFHDFLFQNVSEHGVSSSNFSGPSWIRSACSRVFLSSGEKMDSGTSDCGI